VKSRITKWILLSGAALLLGACSADTDVFGPASETTQVQQVQPVFAPSRSNAEVAIPTAPVPAVVPRRGRYAMAAS
jgi:hypothetical protein